MSILFTNHSIYIAKNRNLEATGDPTTDDFGAGKFAMLDAAKGRTAAIPATNPTTSKGGQVGSFKALENNVILFDEFIFELDPLVYRTYVFPVCKPCLAVERHFEEIHGFDHQQSW